MRGDVLRKQSQITKHSTTSHLSFVQFSNMADAAPAAGPTRGGLRGRGRGGDRGGRGRGRGRRGPRKDEEKEWVPVTKLGRLVRAGKIKSMEVTNRHTHYILEGKELMVRKSICIHCPLRNTKLSTCSFPNSKMKS